MLYELTIFSVPPLVFTGHEIVSAGAATEAINGEVPNLSLTLDNARGEHTQVLAAADALRLRAELLQDGALIFSGAVAAISMASEITIELEA